MSGHSDAARGNAVSTPHDDTRRSTSDVRPEVSRSRSAVDSAKHAETSSTVSDAADRAARQPSSSAAHAKLGLLRNVASRSACRCRTRAGTDASPQFPTSRRPCSRLASHAVSTRSRFRTRAGDEAVSTASSRSCCRSWSWARTARRAARSWRRSERALPLSGAGPLDGRLPMLGGRARGVSVSLAGRTRGAVRRGREARRRNRRVEASSFR